MFNALDVAAEALLEISRPDLVSCLFEDEGTVHFGVPPLFSNLSLRRKYDRINFDYIQCKWPIEADADLALIEKAMRIGLSATDQGYTCMECEIVFKIHGLSHALTQDITKSHKTVVETS